MQVYARVLLLTTVGCGCILLAGCSSVPLSRASKSPALPSAPAAVVVLPGSETLASAHAHYMTGVLSEALGDAAAGQEEFSQALKLDHTNSQLALEFSQRLLAEKKLDAALEVLQHACAYPGASSELYSRLGMVLLHLGRVEESEKACRSSIKLSQKEIEPYRTLFLIQLQTGKTKEALETLQDGVKKGDFDSGDNLQLAEMFVDLMRQAPSLKEPSRTNGLAILNREMDSLPGESGFRLRLGDALLRLGDTTNAPKVFLGVLDIPDEPVATRLECRDKLAGIYLASGDLTNAAFQIKSALRDDPSNFRSYYLLGKIAEDSKKLDEAASEYRRAINAGGNRRPEMFHDLARIQLELRQPDEALKTLGEARGRFQPSFLMELITALSFEQKQDFTNAVSHFAAAEIIAKTTDKSLLSAQFYFDEGSAFERKGDIEQAEVYLQKSIGMAPANAEALNYLGYMWADKGIKLEQAQQLIQKALKAEPKSPAYLDSMAWVFYQMHKPEDALKYAQQAVQFSPEPDATILDHLGDIYAALKNSEKACETWKQSLQLQANPLVQKKLDEWTKARR